MKMVISPAKSLNFESNLPTETKFKPLFSGRGGSDQRTAEGEKPRPSYRN